MEIGERKKMVIGGRRWRGVWEICDFWMRETLAYIGKMVAAQTATTHVPAVICGTTPGLGCTTSREERILRRSESHALPLHRSWVKREGTFARGFPWIVQQENWTLDFRFVNQNCFRVHESKPLLCFLFRKNALCFCFAIYTVLQQSPTYCKR